MLSGCHWCRENSTLTGCCWCWPEPDMFPNIWFEHYRWIFKLQCLICTCHSVTNLHAKELFMLTLAHVATSIKLHFFQAELWVLIFGSSSVPCFWFSKKKHDNDIKIHYLEFVNRLKTNEDINFMWINPLPRFSFSWTLDLFCAEWYICLSSTLTRSFVGKILVSRLKFKFRRVRTSIILCYQILKSTQHKH